MTPKWTTDEFGTRRWHYEGWTIIVWTFSGVDCEGPDGSDLDYDEETGVVGIGFQAPYDGSVRATVPWIVLETYIKTCEEAKAQPAPDKPPPVPLTDWYEYKDGFFGRRTFMRSPVSNTEDISIMVRGKHDNWRAYYFDPLYDAESEDEGWVANYDTLEEAKAAMDAEAVSRGEYKL